ncbi:D-tyrosyl-tRNA(Tyr) deacylase [Devosia sp. BK]|uniref:D-aminoacyl-tRNA deacylase n=1 Tax=Devosia sp. BK TaxID=2871706 RepID=UPI00293A3C71|nr:D-aminoacyl-tRNA deacylase [Devosia sp. BK]MDV3250760.1 D-tyrosyl-tRNA(Tyr) deacylase [Devosia sp. BK]
MRALIQRVLSASVTVDGAITGEIGPGVLVLICAMQEDTEQKSSWLAQKIAKLRIFQDDDGRMNRSLLDIGGSALVVSQFTLAADTKGNRPGFSRAAPPERGQTLYTHFSEALAATGVPIANGIFGADMKVALVNDGPVTIWLDTDNS